MPFHTAHLAMWLQLADYCPYCRASLGNHPLIIRNNSQINIYDQLYKTFGGNIPTSIIQMLIQKYPQTVTQKTKMKIQNANEIRVEEDKGLLRSFISIIFSLVFFKLLNPSIFVMGDLESPKDPIDHLRSVLVLVFAFTFWAMMYILVFYRLADL
ncbi:MAG: hypothetical protein ACXAD7_20270 [Candidatus Kariarchaeaceae archaeon]|jgi:hypothetical protein